MSTKPTKKGIEIEEHLSSVNMDSWFYIYENYVKKDPIKEEIKQEEKDSNS